MLIAAVLLLQAAVPAATPAAGVARMTAVFDQICLKAFPDDARVDEAMVAAKAIALTEAQARVTLRDDPGRGWVVKGGGAPVMVVLELPPYHACSVRGLVGDGPHDLSALDAATDAYARTHPGFVAEPPFEGERGGIHIRATNTVRPLPDGGTDSLMVIAQTVTDAGQLGPGETVSPLRFVHQIRTARVSVAFRREGDDEHLEPKFELPIAPGANLVTVRGLALIEARIETIEAGVAAETDAETIKRLKRDLRYWHTRRATAEVVVAEDDGTAGFGTRITVRGRTGERTYAIVGGDEAAPSEGLLGFQAPLARALSDAAEGDRVAFNGDVLEVISIRPIAD